jgi:hypothetical protein
MTDTSRIEELLAEILDRLPDPAIYIDRMDAYDRHENARMEVIEEARRALRAFAPPSKSEAKGVMVTEPTGTTDSATATSPGSPRVDGPGEQCGPECDDPEAKCECHIIRADGICQCGSPKSAHRPEAVAHHSECAEEQFNPQPDQMEDRAKSLRQRFLPWDEYHFMANPGGVLDQLQAAMSAEFRAIWREALEECAGICHGWRGYAVGAWLAEEAIRAKFAGEGKV